MVMSTVAFRKHAHTKNEEEESGRCDERSENAMCREALGAMRTTSLLCFLSLSSVLLLPAQPATPAFWKQVEIVI
jgi:hypothetical protein